jgi:hypothetical protein
MQAFVTLLAVFTGFFQSMAGVIIAQDANVGEKRRGLPLGCC